MTHKYQNTIRSRASNLYSTYVPRECPLPVMDHVYFRSEQILQILVPQKKHPFTTQLIRAEWHIGHEILISWAIGYLSRVRHDTADTGNCSSYAVKGTSFVSWQIKDQHLRGFDHLICCGLHLERERKLKMAKYPCRKHDTNLTKF